MSKISTAETTILPGTRPPGSGREGPGIWGYLSEFFCCKIWAMLRFRRPRAHQHTRQQIEGSSAVQKGKAREDEETAKQAGEGVKSPREQCQRTKVTVQEAKKAENLQKQNGKTIERSTERSTERRQRAYSTSTMHDLNNSLYPRGIGPFLLPRRPTLSRNTTPNS
jgi:hypothetical protein